MQNKIPFTTKADDLIKLAFNDCVYAWLLIHSHSNPNEFHSYIYKKDFTFQQIAKDINRTRQTVSKRFKELLRTDDNPDGIIMEGNYCGERVYKIPYTNPFQYLHAETVIKLLNLPLKEKKENNENFTTSSKEILENFGHSASHKSAYERIRLNLTVLQGAGIIKFKTICYDNREGMPPMMYVYYVADEGRASDEWLGR